jgi:alpha-glucoside transport system substrate-binding protein
MKRIVVVFSMLLFASLLAFAGGSKESTSSGTQSSTTSSSSSSQSGQIGGTVSMLAVWGGNELDIFNNMVKPFEAKTGVKVQYEGTRDLDAVLTTRVQAGNAPDVAAMPGPGKMAEFANQGKLVDLSTILDMNAMKKDYAQGWLDLGSVNGKMVGIFMKASLKGLVWYNPQAFKAAGLTIPTSWDQLMQESKQLAAKGVTPWAVGLESGSASGWPGTDWLEEIFLKMYGPEKYKQWYDGKLAWTSPEVKKVWETWGQIVADPKMSYGGKQYELSTNFGTALDPIYQSPPKAYFGLQATFIQSFIQKDFPNLKPVTDINFFAFPQIDPQYAKSAEVAGDLVSEFNKTPQASALVKYFTTAEAQSYWVKGADGASPNRQVPLSDYPDELSKSAAQVLTSADITVFDASDMMPSKMNSAFWSAIMNYVSNPGNLDSILANLDQVRKDAYSTN